MERIRLKSKLRNQKIFSYLEKIPKGKVTTYKAIAMRSNVHPRVVASALRKNFNPNIPCWRVIYSDGSVGRFNRGVKKKIRILESEGVYVKKGKIDKSKIIFSI